MNKKSDNESKTEKNIYNTPKLSVHGGLTEITESGGEIPSTEDPDWCPS